MTVYFMHEPSKDYVDLSSAERFGEIEYIFAHNYPATMYPIESQSRAAEALMRFDPSTDFLAFCGGDQGSIGFAIYALAERDIWSAPWLRWDRRRGYYATFIGGEVPPDGEAVMAMGEG